MRDMPVNATVNDAIEAEVEDQPRETTLTDHLNKQLLCYFLQHLNSTEKQNSEDTAAAESVESE